MQGLAQISLKCLSTGLNPLPLRRNMGGQPGSKWVVPLHSDNYLVS